MEGATKFLEDGADSLKGLFKGLRLPQPAPSNEPSPGPSNAAEKPKSDDAPEFKPFKFFKKLFK